jgi:hypothetical protein
MDREKMGARRRRRGKRGRTTQIGTERQWRRERERGES